MVAFTSIAHQFKLIISHQFALLFELCTEQYGSAAGKVGERRGGGGGVGGGGRGEREREREGGGYGGRHREMLSDARNQMLVCLKNESAQTLVRAVTLR